MECYDFSRLDPDTLVTCPFDEVHRVSVQRLVRHLIKCSKVRSPACVARHCGIRRSWVVCPQSPGDLSGC